MIRRAGPPAAAVLIGALAFLVGYGVSVGDALLYIAYELGFVVIPGCLVLLALSAGPAGLLRRFALGWALGYVLEILAFMATAAVGARDLFLAYPVLVGVPAAAIAWRRHRAAESGPAAPEDEDEGEGGSWLGWIVAGTCLLAVAYVALSYFPTAPLPGDGNAIYFIDYPRWISLAADAKNHWPIMDPSVAGEPLPYHYFVNVHLAAASQVTGLGLPLIFLRLFILPLAVLAVLLLVSAGRSLARSPYVGVIAAMLAILIGELRLDSSDSFLSHTPFYGLFFTLLFRSPSFLLGLVFLLPLLILIGERIRDRSGPGSLAQWALVALFMIGASDAKVTILPLMVAALALYAAWRWLTTRRVEPAVPLAAATAVVVAGAVWLMQYRGSASGLRLDPFADVEMMPAVNLIRNDLIAHVGDFPGREALFGTGGVIFGVLGLLLAPLIGIAWLVGRQGLRFTQSQGWLLAILVAGLGLAFALAEPGTQSGMYFLFYGLVAGYLLSAEGLVLAWRNRPSLAPGRGVLIALGAAFAAVLAALVILPTALDLFTGPRASALTYLVRYLGLAIALVALYLAGRRWLGPGSWQAGALVTGAVLLTGALATPFDSLRPAFAGSSSTDGYLQKPLTPGLEDAMAWIREETPTDSTIAVNNQWVDQSNSVPLEFAYSAFAERRVFLEGWGYTQRARDVGFEQVLIGENPFADRLAVNLAAFAGDPEALDALANAGVRYLLVDVAGGYPADLAAIERRADVVYESPEAVVLELPAPG